MEVEGVLEASSKEQPTFQKEKIARRSCQIGAITLTETIRQEIRRLVQGTACNCIGSEISKNVEKNQELEHLLKLQSGSSDWSCLWAGDLPLASHQWCGLRRKGRQK